MTLSQRPRRQHQLPEQHQQRRQRQRHQQQHQQENQENHQQQQLERSALKTPNTQREIRSTHEIYTTV